MPASECTLHEAEESKGQAFMLPLLLVHQSQEAT